MWILSRNTLDGSWSSGEAQADAPCAAERSAGSDDRAITSSSTARSDLPDARLFGVESVRRSWSRLTETGGLSARM